MGSKTREMRRQEEVAKKKIVDGYRRGVCDANGKTLPRGRRGMAGKGSHFRPPVDDTYRRRYREIFGHE